MWVPDVPPAAASSKGVVAPAGIPMGGPNQGRQMNSPGPQGPGGRGMGPQNPGRPQSHMQGMGGPQGGRGMPQQQPNMRYSAGGRNQNLPPNMMAQNMMPMQQQQQVEARPIDSDRLAQAEPGEQKNIIGEELYPRIHATNPDQAGKITGMLLEMDNAELLNLLESPEALHSKIDEAVAVLKNHQASREGQASE
jgi:polyadenylate-binding protein